MNILTFQMRFNSEWRWWCKNTTTRWAAWPCTSGPSSSASRPWSASGSSGSRCSSTDGATISNASPTGEPSPPSQTPLPRCWSSSWYSCCRSTTSFGLSNRSMECQRILRRWWLGKLWKRKCPGVSCSFWEVDLLFQMLAIRQVKLQFRKFYLSTRI